MKTRCRPWILCCLLVLIVLPLPIASASRAPARPPHVLPPNLALVEQWRHTAEVWADPELLATLTSPIDRPDGRPVPEPHPR